MRKMADQRDAETSAKNLRDWFPGHYAPDQNELAEALRNGIIILDANVLLDLYRVIPTVRIEQVNALGKVGDRLWIPHRVGQEFHERRFNAVRDQANLFRTYLDGLEKLQKQGRSSLETLREACGAAADDFSSPLKQFDAAIAEIRRAVTAVSSSCDISMESALQDDHILREIDRLLEGKVGPPFNDDETARVKKSAEKRFAERIPPGYKDSQKEPDRAVGDLLLWEQIIVHSKTPRVCRDRSYLSQGKIRKTGFIETESTA